MNRLSSRKFLLALFTLGASVWLCAEGHIHEGVYSAVVIATVGAYIAGNVAAKQVTKGEVKS